MSAYLSTAAHPYKARTVKRPDAVKNPKSVMIERFKEARGRRYEDRTDAIKLLRVGETNLQKLRRSPSFERFESKLKQSVS